jgi:hypothetical protein
MAKHTPGPWRTVEAQRSSEPLRRGPVYVTSAAEPSRGNVAFLYDKDDPTEADANAYLVRSAPDLYAVVEELAVLAADRGRMYDSELQDLALRCGLVLAQARGER